MQSFTHTHTQQQQQQQQQRVTMHERLTFYMVSEHVNIHLSFLVFA